MTHDNVAFTLILLAPETIDGDGVNTFSDSSFSVKIAQLISFMKYLCRFHFNAKQQAWLWLSGSSDRLAPSEPGLNCRWYYVSRSWRQERGIRPTLLPRSSNGRHTRVLE